MNRKSGAARYWAPAFFLTLALAASIAPAHAQGYDPTARPGARGSINLLAPGAKPQATDSAGPRYDPNDEYSGMPRTKGVETVVAQCAYCHSAALVMQQRLSRERWDKLVDWMVAERVCQNRTPRTARSCSITLPSISPAGRAPPQARRRISFAPSPRGRAPSPPAKEPRSDGLGTGLYLLA